MSSLQKKIKIEPPENWEVVYENIKKMRLERNAPVDTIGCDKMSRQNDPEHIKRLHCLVSLMLSSQTKDEVNHAAMMRLRRHGLTVERILETSEKELEELIYPVGFYRRKAVYLKKTCEILKNDYNGDIPDTVEDLCKLPGVGPKMAYLTMSAAWNIQSGIGVDTHVHRISNRLGWTGTVGTKTPEKTRVSLEEWLPESLWSEINWLLVGFGQQRCLPISPKCGDCLNKDLCPFFETNSKAKSAKMKKKKEKK